MATTTVSLTPDVDQKFASDTETSPEESAAMRVIQYREAINEAMLEEMRRDPTVILLGEDVGKHEGAFKCSRGLLAEFGPKRVRSTPISEAAIVGAAVGAAACGLKAIAEIMYMDFITIAMDQIVNQAAKMRYMFGGKINVSIVVRCPGGTGGRGNAAQHSQSLEAWFMHVPGLKVVMPSTPYDAKGLLKAAIRDLNPVIFVEHKKLYNETGSVPPPTGPNGENDYTIPIGKADVKRDGSDITIVTISRMLLRSLEAAERLSKEGIEAEVIDLRSLLPWDLNAVCKSLEKTGRLIIVEEDCKTAGWGAEVSAAVMEHAFDLLDAPVIRVAGKDVPIPYSTGLEIASVPSTEDIVEACKNC